ncbi:MAG TPA: Gfo/Idh/MocA family oxidoreductase [Fimbriimonas sp.]|nr:Gfo/Idh/MocA family oxidoreductase [Fimbriimonas sp.]
MSRVNVAQIGLGGMGRTHFDCYRRNPSAKVVAICDIDESKLTGDWASVGLNLGDTGAARVDVAELRRTTDYHDLLADESIDVIDICTPTYLHAQIGIDAFHAGKDVLCEKPMGFDQGQCWALERAWQQSGKQLMIAHCLRYWPQYVRAHEIIRSEQYGRSLYARFHRAGATPQWSTRDWMRRPEKSGGAPLDIHIHDVDAALWWFGKPSSVQASGICIHGLPTMIDATWRYHDGPVVALHGGWDNNGGPFRYAFRVVMERATLSCDSLIDGGKLKLIQPDGVEDLAVEEYSAYQAEIDDFIDCIATGRKLTRVTPDDGRLAVEVVREEMRLMGTHV